MQCDFHFSWFPLCSKLRWVLPFSTKRMCNLILQTCYVKQGEMLPILVQNVCAMWLSLLFISSLFQAGGNAALFLKRSFGRAIWFLKPAMENRGKCCPFCSKVLGMQCDLHCCSFLLCSKQWKCCPFSKHLGVQFDSWSLLCSTGGNAAHFYLTILGMQCDFRSYSCLLCFKQGEMQHFFTIRYAI